ncbi:MAG: hypothetical protein JW765_01205 [Deltaproteobacteria bacterium]|nr:hypothetical protein [Candidatus Zymogenaceae bacterium]
MADVKLVKLIKLLADRTNQGSLQWGQTEEKGVFQTSFPNSSVRIESITDKIPDGGDVTYIGLSVYNSEGDLVESINSFDTSNLGGRTGMDLMDKLYEAARRKAMGVDKVLDQTISYLEKKN